MGIFDITKRNAKTVEFTSNQEQNTASDETESYVSFASEFYRIGKENISLPRVDDKRHGASGMVYFGVNNMFPNNVDQMVYSSPINGAIINFKTNATIGGGYSIEPHTTETRERIRAKVAETTIQIKKQMKYVARELVTHDCVYFRLVFSDGRLISANRIPRSNVRNNAEKTAYFICNDWRKSANVETLYPYNPTIKRDVCIIAFEEEAQGIETYSVATYVSALNWFDLDSKMSVLHKNNIVNSIFPGGILIYPKKPTTEDQRQIQKTIEAGKGEQEAGRLLAFFAPKPEWKPEFQGFPTNQNANLFEQTDDRIDYQACKAHCIDPLLMGIRTSGKLGGTGSELKQSYIIFEKNTVKPLRERVEEIFNTLIRISGCRAKLTINDYQIINETFVEMDEDKRAVLNTLNDMNDSLRSAIVSKMSQKQILGLVNMEPEEQQTSLQDEVNKQDQEQ